MLPTSLALPQFWGGGKIERKPEMNFINLLEIVISLIIVLLLTKERPLVVGLVRIVTDRKKHTWKK